MLTAYTKHPDPLLGSLKDLAEVFKLREGIGCSTEESKPHSIHQNPDLLSEGRKALLTCTIAQLMHKIILI